MPIWSVVLIVGGCATSQNPVHDPEFASARPIVSQPLPSSSGAIYRSGYEVVLFEDDKAKRVGDLITVILKETTSATKRAVTKTKKNSEIDSTFLRIFGGNASANGIGLLDTNIEAKRKFNGEGSSKQSNTLFGTITATVSEVYANGNLFIRGEKLLTLNQGVEHVRISGIVRSSDVSPQNTVSSSQLANAKIIYGGEGVIAETNSKGWLQRITDSQWWPF